MTGGEGRADKLRTGTVELLVVEDDRDIARLLRLNLVDAGFRVTVAHDGLEGLEHALDAPVDVVILDVMLPGIDGLEVLRELRRRRPETLVLMLTARDAEIDRVLGLELGADDYLTKPFSVRELLARVKALLRRRQAPAASAETPALLEIGGLRIEVDARRVEVQGREVHLTGKEFDLLLQFARHPGKVYSRAELLDAVWGAGYDGFDHTVNSHINRLRAKLEPDPGDPSYIQTVWGVGYRLARP